MQRCHYAGLRRDETDGRRQQSDNSPVTAADIAAHTVIMDGLVR